MDSYNLPFNLRDLLLCLTFLTGAAVGVFTITKQHKTAGFLTLLGFLFLGIDPIAEVLIFRVLMNTYIGANYELYYWAYMFISTSASLTGVGCLIAALMFAIRPKPEETSSVHLL